MRQALIIIDVQNDYFPHGKWELFQANAALQAIVRLIHLFRLNGGPVYYIRHLAHKGSLFFEADTPGAEIHPAIEPLPSDQIFIKRYPNSFYETGLHPALQHAGITDLVICGMMTHMCVDTTVRAAKDLGYHVTLISDACATRALQWKGETIPAPVVQQVYLASLNQKFADIMTCNEYISTASDSLWTHKTSPFVL